MSMSLPHAAPRARADAGWLFAVSFRPFFVGSSLLAAAAVPLWIVIYLSGIAEVGGMPPMAWHAHEMVFGYLPAVMAGYLLSATPNWTGRMPTSGRPLALLFALWLAGRLLPLVAPQIVGAIADAAFPLSVAAVLLREARIKAPKQSRHGLALFPVLAAASVAHRMLAEDYEPAALLSRVGVAVAILLISAVGGRLVPSLTCNVLAGRGAERVPDPYGRFDVTVLMAASLGLLVWVAAPAHTVTAIAMLAAGVLQAWRLARWRGWLVRRADVLGLHIGYLWVVAGSLLAGLASDALGLVPADAALHAFTAGAIGSMTLAVMARLANTRGPGSRADGGLSIAALIAVNAGAALRVAAPLAGGAHGAWLVAGAGLWSAGFLLFAAAQLLPARGGHSALPRSGQQTR